MRQCPTCLRFFNEETEACPYCNISLLKSYASSEDASEGHFQTPEALQRRIKTLEAHITKLQAENTFLKAANQRLQGNDGTN